MTYEIFFYYYRYTYYKRDVFYQKDSSVFLVSQYMDKPKVQIYALLIENVLN